MSNDDNTLKTVTITTYKDRESSESNDFSGKLDSYVFKIPPKQFNITEKVCYTRQLPINASGARAEYKSSMGKEIKLVQVIDGTGLLSSDDVEKNIDDLKKLAKYNGDTHQPPVIVLEWGSDTYIVRIKEFGFEYKSFNSVGTAKSAELFLTLTEDKSDTTRQKEDKKSSPDLTHQRIAKPGENWFQYSFYYYKSLAYAECLARYNRAKNLRWIESGTTIYIPPLEKLVRHGR